MDQDTSSSREKSRDELLAQIGDLSRINQEAVDLFEADEELGAILGKSFAATYAAIKRAEFETFMEVISPWEREYLLLNV